VRTFLLFGILKNFFICFYDGGGYPYGLRGEAIPLLSRIIAIVDAYDVITHDRPYRSKRSPAEAAQELQRCSGTQFDPDLTLIFLKQCLVKTEALNK
jgi:HD-GYP domain-containing protein (c-di-GMP phosphodiesterase class II)